MNFVNISVRPMGHLYKEADMLELIGQIAGECYNSSMTSEACINRALSCIKRGHHSPLEHVNITLNCTVDRGVSHALVRHRHCAFQQSSTIYQKYDELTFINTDTDKRVLAEIENEYKFQITVGKKRPSEARDVLPNCLATNLIVTTNIRQWMYMLQRRIGPGDSENMHTWAKVTCEWFMENYPRTLGAFDEYYRRHPL